MNLEDRRLWVGEPIVPISALTHLVYCERLAGLIHVEGQWVDNENTTKGTIFHERPDRGKSRSERGRLVLRGVPLWSERLGLCGRADVVEVRDDGTLTPVEYKAGRRHGQTADIQICAQALCLEEMTGTTVTEGFIWYGAWRKRVRVHFDDQLRTATLEAVSTLRGMLVEGRVPPAVDDARCAGCHMRHVCLPEVTGHPEEVRSYVEQLMVV
ncbi:MAG: CRISPR-associated protein Cas4 [Acidimicrobiales bacterium]|nr:MAG: CRISPR-associated protein Cas4 [Acidimicrobiales bacterium]